MRHNDDKLGRGMVKDICMHGKCRADRVCMHKYAKINCMCQTAKQKVRQCTLSNDIL